MFTLHRSVAQATLAACAMSVAVSASAATPKDYAMPYTAGAADNFKGLQLVNSANFAQKSTLVAAATPVVQPHVVIAGTVAGGQVHNLRPHTLVWGQNGHWMAAPLRGGLNPAAVQISSENATASVCQAEPIYRNLADGTTAALFYTLPGANGTCDDGDDVMKWIDVTDGTGAAPTTVTGFHDLFLNPVYKPNGQLQAIYSLQGAKIQRLAPDLVTQKTVKTGVSDFSVVGQLSDQTVISLIDGQVRTIKPAGTLVAKVLKAPAAGFAIASAVLHDGNVYTDEDAKGAGATKTKFFRVAADGTGTPTLMIDLAQPGAMAGFTTANLIYTLGDPGTTNIELDAIPATASGSASPVTIHTATAPQSIQAFTTSADNVFFNVTGISFIATPPYFLQTSQAYVKSDAAALRQDYAANSGFLGGQITDSGSDDIQDQQTFERLMLATGGLDGSLKGSTLNSVNTASLASAVLTSLPSTTQPFPSFGFGPGSIGVVLEANKLDVYAYDLLGLRFRRLTNGTAAQEFPVY